MAGRYVCFVVPSFEVVHDSELSAKVFFSKHLIHQTAEVMHLVVIDGDEDRAVVGEQLAQEL